MVDFDRLITRFRQFGGWRLVWQYVRMGVYRRLSGSPGCRVSTRRLNWWRCAWLRKGSICRIMSSGSLISVITSNGLNCLSILSGNIRRVWFLLLLSVICSASRFSRNMVASGWMLRCSVLVLGMRSCKGDGIGLCKVNWRCSAISSVGLWRLWGYLTGLLLLCLIISWFLLSWICSLLIGRIITVWWIIIFFTYSWFVSPWVSDGWGSDASWE